MLGIQNGDSRCETEFGKERRLRDGGEELSRDSCTPFCYSKEAYCGFRSVLSEFQPSHYDLRQSVRNLECRNQRIMVVL